MDEDAGKITPPVERRVPPSVVATPSEIAPDSDADIVWWRPGWRDAVQHVGYRWLYLTPALGLLILLAWFLIHRRMSIVMVFVGLKVTLTVLVPAAVALAGHVVARAAKSRSEPFCIFCGYDLTGLPDDYRCPECGRAYTWSLIAEYRRDPRWFIERWRARRKLPPAATPFAAGRSAPRRRSRDGAS